MKSNFLTEEKHMLCVHKKSRNTFNFYINHRRKNDDGCCTRSFKWDANIRLDGHISIGMEH